MTTKQSAAIEEQTENKPRRFTRRRFLQIGGILLGGSVAGIYFGRTPLRRAAHDLFETVELPSGVSDFEPDFWFEVLEDNTIRMKSPKVEMGQGIFTGFAMLAAEELGVSVEQIEVVPASTAGGAIDSFGTGGSSSTSSLYQPIREVAATWRDMLKNAAAKQWGTSSEQVAAQEGYMVFGEQRMSYAEIVQTTTEWEIPDTPKLKAKSSFQIIGTERARVDLKPKVMGDAIFAIDAHLPDMLYATVLYSPYIGGTLKMKSVLTDEAEQFPGVVQVIQQDDLLAVVAKNRYAAEMGKRKLKAEWDVPKVWQQAELDALVTVGHSTPVNLQKEGNAQSRFEQTDGRLIEGEYRTPFGVHAHLEPNGVVAHVQEKEALIIMGTQDANRMRNQVAGALGLDTDLVEIRNSFLGGGFGRRYFHNNVVEAARIAQIVGQPVSVFYDREDEFALGYKRPATHHILKAKISDKGMIEAIEHQFATAHMNTFDMIPYGRQILGADLMAGSHTARILYEIEHRSTTVWDAELPFPTGIWRAVGAFANTFAIESFMDELAHEAGQDPIDFRLAHLRRDEASDEPSMQRWRHVLETVREKSGWDTPKPAGVGRGVAALNDRETMVAAVIEVQMIDGQLRVTKATEAIDAGLIVNPEGVRTQCEGCIMMGISAALYEGTYVKDSQFTATNYHQYPMASLMDTPEIEVIMLEGGDKPLGVGEPPIAPIAPAIANAIFDLTGQRLRQLPLQNALG